MSRARSHSAKSSIIALGTLAADTKPGERLLKMTSGIGEHPLDPKLRLAPGLWVQPGERDVEPCRRQDLRYRCRRPAEGDERSGVCQRARRWDIATQHDRPDIGL